MYEGELLLATFEGTVPSEGSTLLLATKVQRCTKVLSYFRTFVRKYESTKVLCTFEGTFVLSKVNYSTVHYV